MTQVTVVVPNYNGEKYIADCLKSLEKQEFKEFHTIVVDNGSTDNSREIIEKEFPKVKLLKLKENYGFARAVNEGIKASKTKYVILLNNDTIVFKRFVRELLNEIRRSKKIFSSQALMLSYQEKEIIDDAGDYYNALGWAFAREKGKNINEMKLKNGKKIFSSCGGAVIYNKELMEKTGYFDEEHFCYLEDVDIGYRAKILGYKNTLALKAKVLHVGSASSGSKYNDFKIRYSVRNNIYTAYKNMPFLQYIINMPLLFTGYFIKLIFYTKLGFLKSCLKGTIEGIGLCKKKKKFPFSSKNIKNYLKIQLELYVNIIRRIAG
ncbi:hypothetical protein SAMN05216249_11047 [Acetitomaculum ruminis DSM 5522]|uniref:Glycosyltransferase 2-like domain-containing protein n=1 Tax=Acetitomaculum ruminis DSM 5522 TaxID=1120918 RepID=A0A1I0YL83_9FIRM|nr:glycosyltransferase family 2 protein [Acetitomaculum ruminis]SFB13210.1 hypothetical protein SAMN05216249_11047 [Acetitomaculum ruminis DSM 5522]